MSFHQVSIEVSKQEKKGEKRVKVGNVNVHVPVLKDIAAFVAGADIKKNDKGEDTYEDGLPVYETPEANWIQAAIFASAKAQARNKLQPGTATLKPDAKIATNWEELYAEGERGDGLALLHAFRAAFAEWVGKQNLSEAAANTLITLVSNQKALLVQEQGTKDKVAARLEKFATDLETDELEKFQRQINSAMEACAAVQAADAMAF